MQPTAAGNNVVKFASPKLAKSRPHFSVVVLRGMGFEAKYLVQGTAEILETYGLNHPWIAEWLATDKDTIVDKAQYDFVSLNKMRKYFLRKGIPVTMRNSSYLIFGPVPTSNVPRLIEEALG